jgi:hypothetical protein
VGRDHHDLRCRGAVRHQLDQWRACHFIEVAYFVGFTLTTLGVGDFVPASPLWQIASVLTALSGLILITLGITYLLSVVGAIVSRRAFAAHVRALGDTPADIVVGGWSGSQFDSAFIQHLVSLASQLTTLSEQRLAYPVVHYFHASSRIVAGSVALANISEAVMLMEIGVAEQARPPRSATTPVQAAVVRNLSASDFSGSVRGDVPIVAPPDLAPLASAGIPLVDAEKYQRAAVMQSERRRTLHRLVRSERWQWSP